MMLKCALTPGTVSTHKASWYLSILHPQTLMKLIPHKPWHHHSGTRWVCESWSDSENEKKRKDGRGDYIFMIKGDITSTIKFWAGRKYLFGVCRESKEATRVYRVVISDDKLILVLSISPTLTWILILGNGVATQSRGNPQNAAENRRRGQINCFRSANSGHKPEFNRD